VSRAACGGHVAGDPWRAHLPPPDPVVEPDGPGTLVPDPDQGDDEDSPVPPGTAEPPVDLPGRETPAPPMRA